MFLLLSILYCSTLSMRDFPVHIDFQLAHTQFILLHDGYNKSLARLLLLCGCMIAKRISPVHLLSLSAFSA